MFSPAARHGNCNVTRAEIGHARKLLERFAREQQLLEAVQRTRQEYEAANQEYKRLMNQAGALDLSHPDGITARREAVQIRNDALKRHMEALEALTQFVLHRR